MSERDVEAHLTCARQWLHLRRDGVRPVTAKTRSSLKRLAKALDGLDLSARLVLYQAGAGPLEKTIDNLRTACRAPLKIGRGRKAYGITYDCAVEHLVLAFKAKTDRSPVSRWKEFRKFAGDVTRDYGAPVPSKNRVLRCLEPYT